MDELLMQNKTMDELFQEMKLRTKDEDLLTIIGIAYEKYIALHWQAEDRINAYAEKYGEI